MRSFYNHLNFKQEAKDANERTRIAEADIVKYEKETFDYEGQIFKTMKMIAYLEESLDKTMTDQQLCQVITY